jgi:type IV pilus assembly protein PilM
MLNIFNRKPASFFGIDLGTAGIKVVNLAFEDNQIVLKNYVSLELEKQMNADGTVNRKNLQALSPEIIESMRVIIQSAGIANHKVAMSVPTSSTFSSIITLPKMLPEALEEAVNYEARRYIPIPIEEVVFGWSVVSGEKVKSKLLKDGQLNAASGVPSGDKNRVVVKNPINNETNRILLIAIPKETSTKYLKIANSFDLDLVALETESFSLARSLVGKKEGVFIIIDIGYKMTSITVVEDGLMIESHNISSVGGEELTKVISNSFGVNEQRAEVLKKEIGLNNNSSEQKIGEIITPILSILVSEVKKNEEIYTRINNRPVDGVILTGGSSAMPGLSEYFEKELALPVEAGDPFRFVVYDDVLKDRLRDLAPVFAVSMGLALRGFEQE